MAGGAQPRRADRRVRAETWDGGFPARSAPPPVAAPKPITQPEDAPTPPPPSARRDRRASPVARARVADPLDAHDDRANCLRCGHVVARARERRGLTTCAACG